MAICPLPQTAVFPDILYAVDQSRAIPSSFSSGYVHVEGTVSFPSEATSIRNIFRGDLDVFPVRVISHFRP